MRSPCCRRRRLSSSELFRPISTPDSRSSGDKRPRRSAYGRDQTGDTTSARLQHHQRARRQPRGSGRLLSMHFGDIGRGRDPMIHSRSPPRAWLRAGDRGPEECRPSRLRSRAWRAARRSQIFALVDASSRPYVSAWTATATRSETPNLTGQLFPVGNYGDAHRAISQIVSKRGGKGRSARFQNEPPLLPLGEISHDKVGPNSDDRATVGPGPLGGDGRRDRHRDPGSTILQDWLRPGRAASCNAA